MKYDLEYAILESILGESLDKSDVHIRWTLINDYKPHYCAVYIAPPLPSEMMWHLYDPEPANWDGYTFEEIVTMMRNDHGWLL